MQILSRHCQWLSHWLGLGLGLEFSYLFSYYSYEPINFRAPISTKPKKSITVDLTVDPAHDPVIVDDPNPNPNPNPKM